MPAALIAYATCHKKRRAVRDGKCRECCQVGRAEEPDDLLPAIIFRAEQHAGPVVPRACPKCATVWNSDGDYARCWSCGADFYRTSRHVIRQPKNRDAFQREAQALRGRPDRKLL